VHLSNHWLILIVSVIKESVVFVWVYQTKRVIHLFLNYYYCWFFKLRLSCQTRPFAALHLYPLPCSQCSGLPAPLLTAMGFLLLCWLPWVVAAAASQRGCMPLPKLTISTLGFSAIFHSHASMFATSNGPTLPIQWPWSGVKVARNPQSISKTLSCDGHAQQPLCNPLLQTCPGRRFRFKCGGRRQRRGGDGDRGRAGGGTQRISGGGGGAAQGSRLSVRADTGEDRMVRGVDQWWVAAWWERYLDRERRVDRAGGVEDREAREWRGEVPEDEAEMGITGAEGAC
jgi:uncharacterized membrane protein YgcG